MDVKQLEKKAKSLRREILDLCHASGRAAHAGPALSCIDIVTALYYHVMRFDENNPDWALRDRFILSKGHACPSVYAVLADMGIVDRAEYARFRHLGGVLQGHMTLGKTPGVDMTAGSLGNGLGIGLGMAHYLKVKNTGSRVYVILGDGELNEGTVWEAVMQAPAIGADNLTAIVDVNGFQSSGATDILPMEPLDDKWRAFGWDVLSIDGHDMEQILSAFEQAKQSTKPTVILAKTVKGKGVSFMEHNNVWHQSVLTDELYAQAVQEVEA
ncbi:MAG: transketolase [Clostridia bacterium]|nr:transketolase [Clostridia bacterium]